MKIRELPSSSAAPPGIDANVVDVEADADLAEALRAAHVGVSAPGFVETIAAARSRRSRRWIPAAVIASAAAAFTFVFAEARRDPAFHIPDERGDDVAVAWDNLEQHEWAAVTSLTMPTDFLLDVPGQARLASNPTFLMPGVVDAELIERQLDAIEELDDELDEALEEVDDVDDEPDEPDEPDDEHDEQQGDTP